MFFQIVGNTGSPRFPYTKYNPHPQMYLIKFNQSWFQFENLIQIYTSIPYIFFYGLSLCVENKNVLKGIVFCQQKITVEGLMPSTVDVSHAIHKILLWFHIKCNHTNGNLEIVRKNQHATNLLSCFVCFICTQSFICMLIVKHVNETT